MPKIVLYFTVLLALFAVYIFAIRPVDKIGLANISQTASLKFLKNRSNLATLGTDNQNDAIVVELSTIADSTPRSHLLQQQSFVLELHRPERFVPDSYEEVIHDVAHNSINPLEPPKLKVSRPENINNELHSCLYRGKVSGDPGSFVSISTCNGQINGWIKTGSGENFSIENSNDQEAHISSSRMSMQSISTLQTQRHFARRGDFEKLSSYIPTVQLVDVLAEAKLEEEFDKIKLQKSGQNLSRNQQVQSGDEDHELDTEDHSSDIARSEKRLVGSSCSSRSMPSEILRKIGISDDELRQQKREALDNQDNKDNKDKTTKLQTLGEDPRRKYLAYPKRYVECVIYHDYKRLQFFNTTRGLTTEDLIAASREDAIFLFNNIITYYEHSNFLHDVTFILKGHVFFSTGDPYTKYRAAGGGIMVISGYGLLENFNKYRNYYRHINHDIGILLSGNQFQSNIKGVANVGSICGSPRYNGNINSVTYRNRVLSSVLTAHESGHTLNAQHDNSRGHIMYPYVTSDTSFSPASKRSIDWMFNRTYCTINNPFPKAEAHDSKNHILSFLGTSMKNEAPKKHPISYIYSSMTSLKDRHDVVNDDITASGYTLAPDNVGFSQAAALVAPTALLQGEPILSPITKPTNKNTIFMISIIAGSVCLFTVALISLLGYCLARYYGPQIMKALSGSTKSLSPTTTTDQQSSRYTFVPQVSSARLSTNTNQSDTFHPATPRDVTPASPYSESTRHRRRSVIEDDQIDAEPNATDTPTINTGIIFEDSISQDGLKQNETTASMH